MRILGVLSQKIEQLWHNLELEASATESEVRGIESLKQVSVPRGATTLAGRDARTGGKRRVLEWQQRFPTLNEGISQALCRGARNLRRLV